MAHVLILLVVALVAAALVFGVVTMITGGDQGLVPAEPDGAAAPLPLSRPLTEGDLTELRFDTAFRGYRMAEVDHALRRTAYDLGYKEELINVLEAEVNALREGRLEDADELRRARERAANSAAPDEAAEVGDGDAVDGDDVSGADEDEADEPGDAAEQAGSGAAEQAGGSADQADRPAGGRVAAARTPESTGEDSTAEPQVEVGAVSGAAEPAGTA